MATFSRVTVFCDNRMTHPVHGTRLELRVHQSQSESHTQAEDPHVGREQCGEAAVRTPPIVPHSVHFCCAFQQDVASCKQCNS
jgi:nitrate reductase cytochrome c-type subunit